jgi:hypothetical protein
MLRRVFVHFAALHFMHKKRSAACAAEQGVQAVEKYNFPDK